MLRCPPAVLLALVLLAPTAAAFSSTPADLSIAYALDATPTMIAAGALFLDGDVSDGLVVAGSNGTVLQRIPELRVVERANLAQGEVIHRGVSLELIAGALVWSFPDGASAALATSERYAIAIALPQAPLPSATARPPAGFILASEEVNGTLAWRGGEAALVPLDAVVTLRDAAGQPLPDWNGRRVNVGATANDNPEGLQVAFTASGAFTTRISASVLGGATDSPQGLRLVIGPAEEDRFAQTATLFADATSGLFPEGAEQPSPLDTFEPVSGLLNGALVLVPAAGGGRTAAPVLLASTFAGEEFPLGPFNLVRGDDLELAWAQGRMTLSGQPTVALGRDGFGVEEPVRVGVFPILSLVLWLAAIGAIVYYFVRRPPKAKGPITLRMASFGVYLLVLLVTFVLWDRSFGQTFGTSALGVMRASGLNADTIATVGTLLALELVPWSIAALLFALPVRIATGVGLRYLGYGKSFKGVATAAGLVSLAIFGPLYALWCFNLVWARIAEAMPAVGG